MPSWLPWSHRSNARTGSPFSDFLSWFQIGRLGLACAVVVLSTWTMWSYHAPNSVWRPGAAVMVFFGAVTLWSALWTWRTIHRHHQLPGALILLSFGFLDMAWLAAGWLATGFASLPFPPLVVLLISTYGFFLGAAPLAALTVLAVFIFSLANAIGVPFLEDPTFSTEAQLALLVGVGVASAIVGNRLRASMWRVERLSEALEQFARHHGLLLERLPIGVLALDERSAVRFCNAQAKSLAETIVGKGRGTDAMLAALPSLDATVKGGGEGTGREAVGVDPGARVVAWRVVVSEAPSLPPLLRQAAQVGQDLDALRERQTLVLLEDVTERQRADLAHRRAEHLEQVAELSAGLAHEVRNPLAAIRSSAEQLGESAAVDPLDRRLTAVVVREADRLDRLVREFLDFARVGGGSPEECSLAGVIRDAVQVAVRGPARERRIGFRVDAPEVTACVDSDLLYRVVSNLCLNAAQHAPEGSDVNVVLTEGPHGVAITVRDRGPGVAHDLRDRIFQPFFTTRKEGAGLGLAIAARSASLMGGNLAVEPAQDGPGAVFTLSLPRA